MRILKRAAAAVALSGAVMGAALAGAAPATAVTGGSGDIIHIKAGCGATKDPSVTGGKAAWTVLCNSNGTVTVDGWVKDTLADNRCAQVYGTFPDGGTFNTESACGWGKKNDFKQVGKGNEANLYLRVR